MEMATFNLNDGFPEAILRGFKGALLTSSDYSLMCQCESLDDMKMHLATTCYGNSLDKDSNLNTTSHLIECCTDKFVEEFQYLRCQADKRLGEFLDICTYPYMIDNIVLIVSGCLHNQQTHELLEKCHPLGMFDSIATLAVAQNMQELYDLVLVDTPLAKYFHGSLSSEDLTEMHIEIMRNKLYKSFIEDFHQFCSKIGGTTAEVMATFLSFEADRRAIAITLNSLGTDLNRDDKLSLFCGFGALHPYGQRDLARVEDFDEVTKILSGYPPYSLLISASSGSEEQMVDKIMSGYELELCKDAFMQQFHYGVFWSYIKLKEQEIRNLMWISECIVQKQYGRIHDGVSF
mmetsp:Transcript_2664/g.6365  ORF Transcript_2664/g.6365 Transcript_2664/m.6365 type:complete len:347 (+) Transcript_2664:201-1241(+)